jgi:hypothetical protein
MTNALAYSSKISRKPKWFVALVPGGVESLIFKVTLVQSVQVGSSVYLRFTIYLRNKMYRCKALYRRAGTLASRLWLTKVR